jgi:acetyl-CoA carboxylase biotin carboxyl carrier protein
LQVFSASCNHVRVPDRELTYEDLLQIVELIKSTSHFSEFRLKVGDIEVSLRRSGGAPPRPVQNNDADAPLPVPRKTGKRQFPEGAHLVRSPMVGTFYRSPQPGQPAFVEVGQPVEPDTTVCIIEVMKLMNSIPAGTSGVVKEIVADNTSAVEYGEVLMVIEPR